MLSGIACCERARPPIQRVHFQPRIIRHRRQACMAGNLHCFFRGIRFARLAVFDDIRRVWKIVQGSNHDRYVLQQSDQFLFLVSISGGQHDLHG